MLLSAADQGAVLDLVLGTDARTPHQLRAAARAAVMVIDPAAADRRAAKAKTGRKVGMYDENNGSATFWANGPKALVAQLLASLDASCLPKGPEDPRTLNQRRFDLLLDLVSGRAVPGQWQAVVLVSLATLTGDSLTGDSEQPAEIPGLGLITATDARDLIAGGATLRRGVIDEHGQLISLDTPTHTPDLTGVPSGDAAAADAVPGVPVRLLTDQIDPTPTEDVIDAEPDASEADLAWWHTQLATDPALGVVAPDTEVLVEMTMGALDHALRALLTDTGLIEAGVGLSGLTRTQPTGASVDLLAVPTRRRVSFADSTTFHTPDPQEGPEGPDGPSGPTGPTGPGHSAAQSSAQGPVGSSAATGGGRPPPGSSAGWGPDLPTLSGSTGPRPTWGGTPHLPNLPNLPDWPDRQSYLVPETLTDREWNARQDWRHDVHETLDELFHHQPSRPRPVSRAPRDGGTPPQPPPRAWTRQAMTTAVTSMTTRPPEPRPAAGSGYVFPPRAARFIKARDITCTFPSCRKLAQACQNDHLIAYPEGPTHIDNAASECVHHHQAKHHYLTVTRQPDGTIRWTTPSGTTTDRHPRPLLRGW